MPPPWLLYSPALRGGSNELLSPILAYEAQLFLLAVLFYLYDSSVLLYSNEAVLTCDRAQRWTATTGRAGLIFAGRALRVLNPFTPHRPSFRLSWNFHSLESSVSDRGWSERARDLDALAPMTLTAGIALYGLLPLGLFTALGAYAILPALAALYGSTLLALRQVHRQKLLVAFGRNHFVGFAFECLACPPFAVNMVRRVTLAKRISEPLPMAAARLLDAAKWVKLRAYCLGRLDEALQLVAEHSDDEKSLEAQKQRLSTLGQPT